MAVLPCHSETFRTQFKVNKEKPIQISRALIYFCLFVRSLFASNRRIEPIAFMNHSFTKLITNITVTMYILVKHLLPSTPFRIKIIVPTHVLNIAEKVFGLLRILQNEDHIFFNRRRAHNVFGEYDGDEYESLYSMLAWSLTRKSTKYISRSMQLVPSLFEITPYLFELSFPPPVSNTNIIVPKVRT